MSKGYKVETFKTGPIAMVGESPRGDIYINYRQQANTDYDTHVDWHQNTGQHKTTCAFCAELHARDGGPGGRAGEPQRFAIYTRRDPGANWTLQQECKLRLIADLAVEVNADYDEDSCVIPIWDAQDLPAKELPYNYGLPEGTEAVQI